MAPGTTFEATQGKLCLIFAVPLLVVKRLELIPGVASGHCEGSRKSESQFRVFPHVFVRQAFQPVSLHTNVGKFCKIRWLEEPQSSIYRNDEYWTTKPWTKAMTRCMWASIPSDHIWVLTQRLLHQLGPEDRVKLKGPPVRHGEAGATPCVLYESRWTCPTVTTVLSARWCISVQLPLLVVRRSLAYALEKIQFWDVSVNWSVSLVVSSFKMMFDVWRCFRMSRYQTRWEEEYIGLRWHATCTDFDILVYGTHGYMVTSFIVHLDVQ